MCKILQSCLVFTGILFLFFLPNITHADIDTIEIRILPESIVYGEYYTLGDIAEFDGFDVESIQQLARLKIGKSPLPGHSHILSHGQVKRKVNKSVSDRKINVALPPRPIISRASIKITKKQLEEIALKEIKQHYQDYEEVKIHIKTRLKDIYMPKGNATYEMKRIGETIQVGGYSTWALSLKLNGEEVKKIFIQTKIEVFDDVMMAKERIPKGKQIQKVDLVSIKKNVSREKVGFKSQSDLMVGQVARRDIYKNESIKKQLIGQPIIVKKGTPVRLIFKSKNLTLTNLVKALKSGKKGEVIPVRPIKGKRTIYATILDEKNVEVAL